ncbi:MAG: TetR/AcrR family transcriptional regulator [Proteobacteria bacterium]|nr:TetR/AcrR family transcriptional regulator [Pseudomonadota bacterium]NOG60773.1 TetR/AcrR family transcriptional regulator [Pseudomonadota bacterium]
MKNAAENFIKKDTAETILEAAVNRFSVYGYNKTTMAEIAEDAGMSAANIYRYYKSKEEIAAACTKNCMCEKANVLKDIVRNKKLSATEKLEKYVLATLRMSQEAALENKKIDEVCAEITKSNPQLIHDKIASNKALLIEILSYGNQTGEFKVDDIMDTAVAINAMIVVFDVPMFMSLYSPEEFEDKAKSVIRFLLSGLKN